ncbi:MAG: glycogen operon protein GlgX [Clostridiales bacterium]|nr:glycogen operon protein GlgX [Clostridiales bacterium]
MIKIRRGNYAKLGAQYTDGEATFTFFAEKEDECEVVLVKLADGEEAHVQVPHEYAVGSLRSVAVAMDNPQGCAYYYKINGKRVMDDFAQRVVGRESWNDETRAKDGYQVMAAFSEEDEGWDGDVCPEIKRGDVLMYKLHVRGFTMDAEGAKDRGTFRALTRRIGYLKKLGVTTVELMPMYEFEEMPLPEPVSPEAAANAQWESKQGDIILPEEVRQPVGRLNYWGYAIGNYYAVKASYAYEPEHAALEFGALVRRLHAEGMECVMEMFFPEEVDRSGITEILQYWVLRFHVDGFHLLGRDLPVTEVVRDKMLSRTKIFCERYPGDAVDIRRCQNLFVYRDEYLFPARRMLNQIGGSMKEFMDQQRKQGKSHGYVNYLASNNGFTLADTFMYTARHNEDNGEDNRDGSNWNFSNNFGVEGPSRKRRVNALRKQKWRSAVMMLMFAQGVPMIWSGDEMGNSQGGNNNAYCQDNPIGWMNWKNERTHKAEIAFLQKIVEFRKSHRALSSEEPFRFEDYERKGFPDISYHGENAWLSGSEEGRQSLGVMYAAAYARKLNPDLINSENAENDGTLDENVYIAYNFGLSLSALALPQLPEGFGWYLVMDSANENTPILDEPVHMGTSSVPVLPQSIRVLVSRPLPKKEPAKPAGRKPRARKPQSGNKMATAQFESNERGDSHV